MKYTTSIPVLIILILLAGCPDRPAVTQWTTAQEALIQAAAGAVSETQIGGILDELDGERNVWTNPAEIPLYESRITAHLQAAGCTVRAEPVTAADGRVMNNLIGTREGAEPGLAPVMVSAHWDCVAGTAGMDDNASGCAGVLEAARVLQGVNLQRTVIYALFAYEEQGMVGSYRYIENGGVLPACLINLDMIAYTTDAPPAIPLQGLINLPARGDFIAAVSLDWCWNLGMDFNRACENFAPGLPVYMAALPANVENTPLLNNTTRSDHLFFWQLGIPALFVTDLAGFRNPNYHLAGDNLASLDLGFCTNVVKTIVAWLCIKSGVIVP